MICTLLLLVYKERKKPASGGKYYTLQRRQNICGSFSLYPLMERSVAYRRDGGGEGGEGASSRPAVHFCQDPQHTGGDNKEALYQKPSGIQRKILEL
jgi:hypothetical protein